MATQQFDLEIINVSPAVFTKTARGGYNSMEIAYKNITFENKVEGKKLVDFNDKAVFEFFKGLKNGDKVTVTKDKGDNDQYWKWVGADFTGNSQGTSAGTANAPVQQSSTNAGTDNSVVTRGRVTGSNYETSEERAARQRYIVRQSSVGAAIELLKANGAPFDTGNVIDVAKQFEAFVFDKGEIPF